LPSERADVSSSIIKAFFLVQLGYLEVTAQEKLRSGWPGPFVKVEGCCDFICLISVRADISSSVKKGFFLVQLGYLDVTLQEKLRSGWQGPFVKVEGCCD
jgi:hypothetical protein